MKITAFLLLILVTAQATGQPPALPPCVAEIGNFYATHPKLSMEVQYRFYHAMKDQTPFLTKKATIYINQSFSCYASAEREVILNSDYYVYADHEKKSILLARRSGPGFSFNPKVFVAGYTTMMTQCKSVQAGKEDSLRFVLFRLGAPGDADLRMVYGSDFSLRKMVVSGKKFLDAQFTENAEEIARVEIVYTSINKTPAFQENQFNYSRYLNHFRGSYKAKAPYLEYEVKNLYSKNTR